MNGRPYIGMDLNGMRDRFEKACKDCLDEAIAIGDELSHRSTRGARSLLQQVEKVRESLQQLRDEMK